MTQTSWLSTILQSSSVRATFLRKIWKYISTLLLTVNKESWEKFEEQKNSLTAAIDLGEQEKSEIQRVD